MALWSFKRVKSVKKIFPFFSSSSQIMWLRLLIISLWTCSSLTSKSSSKEEDTISKSHHRQKRFLWMTQEKRLVLPPGTQLVLTPTLAMPLLRYPPSGLDANLTISTPFTRNDFLSKTKIVSDKVLINIFLWMLKLLLKRHFLCSS